MSDEYTDYSCSTSIERLARDVETILRKWHVDNNSDRHVSAVVGKQAILKKQLQNDSTSTAQSVELIRAEQLSWTLSYPTDGTRKRVTCQIDLELSLWEGPLHMGSGSNAMAINDDENELPFSLRRNKCVTSMPAHLFENFSALFGFGQHITLCPVNPEGALPPELIQSLVSNLLERHHKSLVTPDMVGPILSQWLQMSLNLSASHCGCRFPVVGIWGQYQPRQKQQHMKAVSALFPSWMNAAFLEVPDRFTRTRHLKKRHWNENALPCLVAGKLLSEHYTSTFWCQALKHNKMWRETQKWTMWANLLLRHCSDSNVALWGARHTFVWSKWTLQQQTTLKLWKRERPQSAWRRKYVQNGGDSRIPINLIHDDIEPYVEQCRLHALHLIEEAAGATDEDPYWGPPDDPIAFMHATLTWDGLPDGLGQTQPLLMFPLKSRSRFSMSEEDRNEMEQALESTILDIERPSTFTLKTFYDRESAQVSLAATQRCILAALIRTATLPRDTLLKHLVDETLIESWNAEAGNRFARILTEKVHADSTTHALVAAMDWKHASEDIIERWQAEKIVQEVLDGRKSLSFPSPPDNIFIAMKKYTNAWSHLPKAAPPGRLLSILFVRMARVRSPSSIAMVWNVFVEELRRRWETRESLPNMTCIPGLDPMPESTGRKRCFSTIGAMANFAAYVNCSEPDPDDFHCLVGQKLQVFNICLETVVANQLRAMELEEKRSQQFDFGSEKHPLFVNLDEKHPIFDNLEVKLPNPLLESDDKRPSLVGDIVEEEVESDLDDEDPLDHIPSYLPSELSQPLPPKSIMNGSFPNSPSSKASDSFGDTSPAKMNTPSTSFADASVGRHRRKLSSMTAVTQYFDAEDDVDALFEFSFHENVQLAPTKEASKPKRSGARCPVQGVSLVSTGDQLYAPYLQRPFPLTDDVIAERQVMLARQEGSKASTTIRRRLEIAHRFQKPKLLSDMQAFKAANPDALFQDFINWYGNPDNPLEDHGETQYQTLLLGDAAAASVEVKLDRAAEAIKVLNETRDFWSKTWEEASPKAAEEQGPLFDPATTIEMVLDFLETLHPASLLCQVMAVNLAMSYFALFAAAGDAYKVPVVRTAMDLLREKTVTALQKLSLDATTGVGSVLKNGEPVEAQSISPLRQQKKGEIKSSVASLETIMACESACVALSHAEAVIARATSLLHKLPYQYELVETIMTLPESTPLDLKDALPKTNILNAVHDGQKRIGGNSSSKPIPFIREYLLRNVDHTNPCQLCVRYSDDSVPGDGRGGLLVALAKSRKNSD